MRKAILLGILFVANHGVLAQTSITLRGTLKDNKGQPVTNTEIAVRGDAFSTTKADASNGVTHQKSGQFAIALSNKIVAGATISLLVRKAGWTISEPPLGKMNTPSLQQNAWQIKDVTIAPLGSPLLLSPEHLTEYISRIKDELTRRRQEVTRLNRNFVALDANNKAEIAALKQQVMTDLLGQWEKDYGLTVAKMEEVISQYARTANPADDKRTRGLKAFQNNEFEEAARLLAESGDSAKARAKQLREQAAFEEWNAFKDYKDAGDAYSANLQFAKAIEMYDLAAELVSAKDRPQEWAKLEDARGYVRTQFGRRITPTTAKRFLNEAIQYHQSAITIFTREGQSRDLAIAQSLLGLALQTRAELTNDVEKVSLYSKAEQAHRQALHIFATERLWEDWATVQNNLGNLLSGQARWAKATEQERLYAAAIDAFRQALFVLMFKQQRLMRVQIQNNLGVTLLEQAEGTAGKENARIYAEAEQIYRQALLTNKCKETPELCATMQVNLAKALHGRVDFTPDAEHARLFDEAEQAVREALRVFNFDGMPQFWAVAQNQLGILLSDQAALATGAERVRRLAEAKQAFLQTLRVFTREHTPQQWALTQAYLGDVLRDQAALVEITDRTHFYAEAEGAYRQALLVLSSEHMLLPLASTQKKLGDALLEQAMLAEVVKKAGFYVAAIQAYGQALDVYTSEQLPHQVEETRDSYARTHIQLQLLGTNLTEQAANAEGVERLHLYDKVVQIYRQTLLAYPLKQEPVLWVETQNKLGDALREQAASVAEGESRNKLLVEAIQAFDNVMSRRPNDIEVLKTLSFIYYEQLFRFPEAFALNERRAKLKPDDLSVQSDWAENHFTTARFAEGEMRLGALIANPKLEADTGAALCVIDIANALALGKMASVKTKLGALIATVTQQPADFRVGWSFNGTLHFIGTHESFAARRDWLRQLITALQAENRDAILTSLRAAQKNFRE